MTYLVSTRHKDGKKNIYECDAECPLAAREIVLRDIPTASVALTLIKGGK